MGELPRQKNRRVRAEVLWRIDREHIERALSALDDGAKHAFAPSTDYDLLARGRRYAPKAVLGAAAAFAIGQQLVPDDFSGGEDSTCFKVLRDRGYEVVPKQADALERRVRRTWIFQGNPDLFDIDGYIGSDLPRISWLVRKHREEIREGDRVFLWRAAGKSKAVSGVIAECTVLSDPWLGPDEPEGRPYWRTAESGAADWRVWLRVDRRANVKQVIKRDWLKSDPICRDLLIVRQAAGTNYPVTPECEDRLDDLWSRTGEDWTRADSIAGLWAYDVTYGVEVSKKGDGPIAQVALRIGRAVGGVYNKVMNFRALDPRDPRAGLPAGARVDDAVWAEFYDAHLRALRSDDLQSEYSRLWLGKGVGSRSERFDSRSDPPPTGKTDPSRERQTAFRVIRDSAVTRWVKNVHDHRCQICGLRLKSPRGPIAEGAHVRPLGANHKGPDDVRNVLCLCPNHHAQLDAGALSISDELRVARWPSSEPYVSLRTDLRHQVGREYLRYHREHVAGRPGYAGKRERAE